MGETPWMCVSSACIGIDPEGIMHFVSHQSISHLCSWSECAVDDTDDSVVGDNRDGDEQWYQYRTQEFCANAAYSLYGAKKEDSGFFGCTRGHFINSFFTYGGADNLLQAVGITPVVYYNNDGGNGNKQGSSSGNSNAVCHEIESDGQQQQSGDDNSLVSSMGCNAVGGYNIASFQASNCDGNYFLKEIDSFDAYNNLHSRVGCHRIWDKGMKSDYALMYLLNNSWSCDLELYPNGCPDPYGNKERWDYALRTVANGGNAQLAYRNMLYKMPLRILSIFFAALAFVTVAFGYYVRNRERVHSKGGKFRGFLRCIGEDIYELVRIARKSTVKTLRSQIKKARRKRKKAEKKGTITYEVPGDEEPGQKNKHDRILV